jgi:hypothetical protein
VENALSASLIGWLARVTVTFVATPAALLASRVTVTPGARLTVRESDVDSVAIPLTL